MPQSQYQTIVAIWKTILSRLLQTEATEATIHNVKVAFIGGLEASLLVKDQLDVALAINWIESHV